MTLLTAIEPQVLLIILIPIIIFIIGYFFGKKAGYFKRIKEDESKELSKDQN